MKNPFARVREAENPSVTASNLAPLLFTHHEHLSSKTSLMAKEQAYLESPQPIEISYRKLEKEYEQFWEFTLASKHRSSEPELFAMRRQKLSQLHQTRKSKPFYDGILDSYNPSFEIAPDLKQKQRSNSEPGVKVLKIDTSFNTKDRKVQNRSSVFEYQRIQNYKPHRNDLRQGRFWSSARDYTQYPISAPPPSPTDTTIEHDDEEKFVPKQYRDLSEVSCLKTEWFHESVKRRTQFNTSISEAPQTADSIVNPIVVRDLPSEIINSYSRPSKSSSVTMPVIRPRQSSLPWTQVSKRVTVEPLKTVRFDFEQNFRTRGLNMDMHSAMRDVRKLTTRSVAMTRFSSGVPKVKFYPVKVLGVLRGVDVDSESNEDTDEFKTQLNKSCSSLLNLGRVPQPPRKDWDYSSSEYDMK